jgi:hypothetical protein
MAEKIREIGSLPASRDGCGQERFKQRQLLVSALWPQAKRE